MLFFSNRSNNKEDEQSRRRNDSSTSTSRNKSDHHHDEEIRRTGETIQEFGANSHTIASTLNRKLSSSSCHSMDGSLFDDVDSCSSTTTKTTTMSSASSLGSLSSLVVVPNVSWNTNTVGGVFGRSRTSTSILPSSPIVPQYYSISSYNSPSSLQLKQHVTSSKATSSSSSSNNNDLESFQLSMSMFSD